MKKANYRIRVSKSALHHIECLEPVEGMAIDDLAAVRKINGTWTIDIMETGLAFVHGKRTRKEAIAEYEEKKNWLRDFLNTDQNGKTRLAHMLEAYEALPTMEEVEAYEELDVVTTYDYRFDEYMKTAKKDGCIVKDVRSESYQHGGHFKAYGSAEALQGLRDLVEHYKNHDANKVEEGKAMKNENMVEVGMQFVKKDGILTTVVSLDDMKADFASSDGTTQTLYNFATSRRICDIEKALFAQYVCGADPEPKTVAEDAAQTEEKAAEPDVIDIDTLTPENIADYIGSIYLSLAADKHNNSIIMCAGIDAGIIAPMDVFNYFKYGRMPAVHTFDIWKKNGYSVKKGEKAAFEAHIWKWTEKNHTLTAEEAAAMNGTGLIDGINYEEGQEITKGDYIRKKAYFFTFAQVEKTHEAAPLPDLPEDVKKETRNGCTWISGNTRPIKEDLKAAGYRWSKKNGAWFKREAA